MENKKLISKTWRKVKLEEVVEIIDGDRGINYPNGSDFSGSGFCLFLNTKNVTGSNFDFSECQFITQKKDEKLRKGKLQRSDFILTTRGTIGNIAHYNEDVPYENMRINSGMVILRPKNNLIINNFFYLFLISEQFKNQIGTLKSGSAQPQLPIRDLKFFEIELPSLDQQKNIVKTLLPLAIKIELNNKINRALEQMAQVIFKEWFVKFKFPDYQKVKMVDSELGKIPDGWEVKQLGKIADITIGRTPPREQHQWFTTGSEGKKWISIKDMGSSGIYLFDTSEKLTNEAIAKFNITNIPKDTVVVSFKLTLGRVALTTEDMASNEAIAHLHIKKETRLFPEYVYLLMRGVNLANFGSTSSIGTAVNSKTVRNVPMLLPDSETLNKAHDILVPIFLELKRKLLENQKLIALRDLLLPKLMSGKMKV